MLPNGSLILQILSDENCTLQGNTAIWNTPIDELAVQFILPNLGVTDALLAKTVVSQGYTASANVTVINNSTCAQTLNVAVFANTTSIKTQTVILESNISTTINLILNTSDLAKGNYSITVSVDIVPDEMNIEDNMFVAGWILVTSPGDIAPDYNIVDIFDITTVALAFNSEPGDSNWNTFADVNNDQLVDIFDIVVVALHFGETG
ncbi:hypothetical protein MUO74_10650 [Candidatus Bathyarchaeota archaeon]|nr:hypothetical protein [Candidatus Bathyarchaeota archaeon]